MEPIKTHDRYAIFQKGLKQYQAVEGKTLAIDRLAGEPGDAVEFEQVLFRKTGPNTFEIGKPFLQNAIKAIILKHTKGEKTIGMRFQRRKKVSVVNNGRSALTVIRFESV